MSDFQVERAVKKFIYNHEIPPINATISYVDTQASRYRDILMAGFWMNHKVQGEDQVFLPLPWNQPNLAVNIYGWDESDINELVENAPYQASFVPLIEEVEPASGCVYEAPIRWGVPCAVVVDKVFSDHDTILRAKKRVRIEYFMLHSPDMMKDWRKLLLKIQKEFGKGCVEDVLRRLN